MLLCLLWDFLFFFVFPYVVNLVLLVSPGSLQGHAQRLISAGCMVPFPLHVEHSRGEGVTICMTQLEGATIRSC